jgi:4a-hydroxytetrahydrobiopterin dehydratase
MAVISAQQADSLLALLPDWQIEAGELVRTFKFDDFVAALDFVNRVGKLAEKAGHHPDIDIRYNKVRLALISHDAGGLTNKDFELAGQTDKAL